MFTEVSIMTIENEDELSTKNETDTESMKTALARMTDEDIQNIFDRAFEDFQRSKLNPNYENKD